MRGIHRGPVNSPHKWLVTQKMFPFDDVIMSGSKFKISFGSGDVLYCLFSVRFLSLTNDFSLAIGTSWAWLSDLWEMFKENVSENVHQMMGILSGALFQYPIRLLILRSHKVSKPRDLYLKLSSRSESWQAHRQHCYRGTSQISKWCDNSNYQSRRLETSQDLTVRRRFGFWNGAKSATC